MSKYLVVIIIGLFIYSFINYKMINKLKIKRKDIIMINILEISSIFLGSKLLDIIVYYNDYENYDLKQILFIGFMVNGGIILRIIVIYLYSKLIDINVKKIFSIIVPNTLLLYSLLKLGCFINGCCYGINNIPLPIIESIIYLFIYLYIIRNNNIISNSCIIFGILRIISFLIRDDINFNGLVVNIILCLCFIFSGIITYVYGFRKNINL